ncbi:MAG TPA: hypothetical protein VF553_21280 [Pyrinomonadaceae bacterium]|jgi:uncharacterized membrane protein YccC
MKLTIKFMLRAAAAVLLAAAFAPLVTAQQRERDASADQARMMREERERRMREYDLRQRALDLRMLEESANRPRTVRREPRLALMQIREDFRRIQIVNNDLSQAASSASTLDLKFVARSASEIKKLAKRLKDNLVLPKPENASEPARAEVGAEAEQLKSSLSVLRGLIDGFVSNPVFKEPNVIDAQNSFKARRDLEEIIALSDQVKKSSEKMEKLARKTQ